MGDPNSTNVSASVSGDSQCNSIRFSALTEKQKQGLNIFHILLGVVLGLNFLVFCTSKFILKDPHPDYFVVMSCSLSLLDFASDIVFVQSLKNFNVFKHLYTVGVLCLSISSTINFVGAVLLFYSERSSSAEVVPWLAKGQQRPCLVVFFLCFSVFKSNAILVMASGLFGSKTDCFGLQVSETLQYRLHWMGLSQVVLEDIPQVILLWIVQSQLEKWTEAHILSVGIGLITSVFALVVHTYKVYKGGSTRNLFKQLIHSCLRLKSPDPDPKSKAINASIASGSKPRPSSRGSQWWRRISSLSSRLSFNHLAEPRKGSGGAGVVLEPMSACELSDVSLPELAPEKDCT